MSISYFPTALSYNAVNYNPRTRYLAAIAEAKAAEAEYLAAETTRREELALRQRLEEIQIHKQEQELLLNSQYPPYTQFHESHVRPTYGYDRLSVLRQQVDKEEHRLRLLALREAQFEHERRKRHEDSILDIRRQQHATLRREAAEALAVTNKASYTRQCGSTQPRYENYRARPKPSYPVAVHPALRAILGPEAQAIDHTRDAPTRSACCRAEDVPSCACAPQSAATGGAKCLYGSNHDLYQLFGTRSEASKSNAYQTEPRPTPRASRVHSDQVEKQTPNHNAKDLEQFLSLLGLPAHLAQLQAATPSLKESAGTQVPSEGFRHIAELLGLSAYEQAGQQSAPQGSASSSSKQAKQASVKQDTQQTRAPDAPTSASAQVPVETSLKTQLETRLNNEFYSEVKDTIQAILASLQDASPSSQTSPATEAENTKGKGKSTLHTTNTTTTAPTSKDVVNSMETVHSIDTAFHALEVDFVFPPQLDFLATHIAASASPTSTDSEASATKHLAYTSRNHPVRFYEQALSALLAQLDAVDSFGNDQVRERRKEVVVQVERALEELEREVEGRWKSRLNKEAKAVEIQVTDPARSQSTSDGPQPEGTITGQNVPQLALQTPEAVAEVGITPQLATSEGASTLNPTNIAGDNEVSTAPAPALSNTTSSDHPISLTKPTLLDNITPTITAASATSEVLTTNHEIASSAIDASTATIKGYDAEDASPVATSPIEVQPADAFLLAASDDAPIPKRPNNRESDDGASEWSEVEA